MTNKTSAGSGAQFHYDGRTIALHWASAFLVALLWCAGQSIDWFPRGDPRVTVRSAHIVVGLTLCLVVLYRLVWRARAGRQLPSEMRGGSQRLATLLHKLLYVLLLGTVALGIANVWVRGDTLFGLLAIPQFDPGNKALVHQVEDLHALCANTLAGAALVHALIALAHHFWLHDGVLLRMRAPR